MNYFFPCQKLKDKYSEVVFAKVDVDDAEVSKHKFVIK